MPGAGASPVLVIAKDGQHPYCVAVRAAAPGLLAATIAPRALPVVGGRVPVRSVGEGPPAVQRGSVSVTERTVVTGLPPGGVTVIRTVTGSVRTCARR